MDLFSLRVTSIQGYFDIYRGLRGTLAAAEQQPPPPMPRHIPNRPFAEGGTKALAGTPATAGPAYLFPAAESLALKRVLKSLP